MARRDMGSAANTSEKPFKRAARIFIEYSPPHYGKLYCLTLERLGFHEIKVDDPDHYNFIRGDVMVMQPHKSSIAGHVAGYDGQKWISDFVQPDFWAGKKYRSERPQYAVYRY